MGGRRTGGVGGKEKRCRWEAGTGRRSRHREAESQSGILNVITCFDDLDSASTICSLAGSAAATLPCGASAAWRSCWRSWLAARTRR